MKEVNKLLALFLLCLGRCKLIYIKEDVQIQRSQLLTILTTLPYEYEISFEIKPTAYSDQPFACIIHLTLNTDSSTLGDRIYGIWVNKNHQLHFSLSISGDLSQYYATADILPIMKWTKIKLTQTVVNNQYTTSLYVGEVNVLTALNSDRRAFENVKVYLSDPWYDIQPGFIKNLYITNAVVDNFYITEETSLVQNRLVAVLNKLPKEYQLSFEIKPTQFLNDSTCVVHLTNGEGDGLYGSITPLLLIEADTFVSVYSAINSDWNYSSPIEMSMPLLNWTKIKITQIYFENNYIFFIEIDETRVYEIVNNNAREFENVKVYLSSPWFPVQPGYIRNFIIINAIAASTSVNTLPNWSAGYYSNRLRGGQYTTDENCVLFCWQKVLAGELVIGAARDTSWCYCTVKSLLQSVVAPAVLSNRHIEFLLSYVIKNSSSFLIGELVTFHLRIRFFNEGNDKSLFYFIDDLEEPLKRSGRVIITNIADYRRSSFVTRIFQRHNETYLINYLEETYYGIEFYTEFENLYDVFAKIGDLSVTNGRIIWALLLISNSNSIWVSLTPFTIFRPEKNCSLVALLSNYTVVDKMFCQVSITTSRDCVNDLENVNIFLRHEPKLTFNGLQLNGFVLNSMKVMEEKYFTLIHVDKLFIDCYINLSTSYIANKNDFKFGIENVTVISVINWYEFFNDKPVLKVMKHVFFFPIEKQHDEGNVTRIAPIWNHFQQNGTSFLTKKYQYECRSIHKRQQSPCYEIDLTTGRIKFLPIQMLDMVGYDSLNSLIYGYTFQNHIVECNLERMNPTAIIISNEKWLRVRKSPYYQKSSS